MVNGARIPFKVNLGTVAVINDPTFKFLLFSDETIRVPYSAMIKCLTGQNLHVTPEGKGKAYLTTEHATFLTLLARTPKLEIVMARVLDA
jgi:hypothetical protein